MIKHLGIARLLVLAFTLAAGLCAAQTANPTIRLRGTLETVAPGASVSIAAQEIGGKPTALRINAGRNGFAIP